ncbi:MAG: hypothetical protein PHQ55_04195 [Eubacteriales bacterium]|nr:hypothetical protein [Eubacteriales bacterium]MDD4682355.1 hypothetical protein [Eubacteriales bacterium]
MQDVKSFLEKSFSFGVGLAAWSREKIEDTVEEMVKKGEIAQKDARDFANDLVKKGESQREELSKLIHEEVRKAVDQMDLPRREDVIGREELAAIVREQVEAALGKTDIQD